jgi:hypothetical protein
MSEEPKAYVGTKACGCAVAAIIDGWSLHPKVRAKIVATLIESGLAVERLPLEEAGALLAPCHCDERKDKQKPLPGMEEQPDLEDIYERVREELRLHPIPGIALVEPTGEIAVGNGNGHERAVPAGEGEVVKSPVRAESAMNRDTVGALESAAISAEIIAEELVDA